MTFDETIERVNEISEDENGGHGYVEHASIGSAIVHVFYADDNEGYEKVIGSIHTEDIQK